LHLDKTNISVLVFFSFIILNTGKLLKLQKYSYLKLKIVEFLYVILTGIFSWSTKCLSPNKRASMPGASVCCVFCFNYDVLSSVFKYVDWWSIYLSKLEFICIVLRIMFGRNVLLHLFMN